MGPGPIRENNSYHREVKDGAVASAPAGAKCGGWSVSEWRIRKEVLRPA